VALKGAAKNQLLSHDGNETMKEREGWAEIVVDSGGEVKSRWEADVPALALSRFAALLVWCRGALILSEAVT
jgi:hypothetical protein